MDMKVFDIVAIVVCVIGYGLMIYFKIRGDLVGSLAELIAAAESTGLVGSEKMAQVVARLAEMVPAPLKGFLTESVLRKLAQGIFDWMKQYALNYIEAKKEKDLEQQEKALFEKNAETTAAIVADLIKLSRNALLEKAASEYGIEADPTASKEELVKAIVLAALNKA